MGCHQRSTHWRLHEESCRSHIPKYPADYLGMFFDDLGFARFSNDAPISVRARSNGLTLSNAANLPAPNLFPVIAKKDRA
jgi:hypothetical protein